ncbi:MAG: hypothetical protein IJ302_02895 [Clostridia bacterium]|nr:hypothetical protein [Clostridia bacterium]
MKRLSRILILLLALLTLPLASCRYNEPEQAAADLLDRVIACEADAVAALMGYDILSLTDIERYTLTRMEYKIIDSEQRDTTRWDVTVDTSLFDIMMLLNEAVVQTYVVGDGTFQAGTWILEQLNTEEAARASFRAVIPFVYTDGTWQVDTARIGDDLRDAVSGGAYSWYNAYKATFGDSAGMDALNSEAGEAAQ